MVSPPLHRRTEARACWMQASRPGAPSRPDGTRVYSMCTRLHPSAYTAHTKHIASAHAEARQESAAHGRVGDPRTPRLLARLGGVADQPSRLPRALRHAAYGLRVGC